MLSTSRTTRTILAIACVSLALAQAVPPAFAGTQNAGTSIIAGEDAKASARGTLTEGVPDGAPGVLTLKMLYQYSEGADQNRRDRWTVRLSVDWNAGAAEDRKTQRVIEDAAGSTDSGGGDRILTWHWSEFGGRDAGGVYQLDAVLEQGSWLGGLTVKDEAHDAGAIQVTAVSPTTPSN